MISGTLASARNDGDSFLWVRAEEFMEEKRPRKERRPRYIAHLDHVLPDSLKPLVGHRDL